MFKKKIKKEKYNPFLEEDIKEDIKEDLKDAIDLYKIKEFEENMKRREIEREIFYLGYDNNPGLAKIYLKSNNNQIGRIREDEDEEESERDIHIIYNRNDVDIPLVYNSTVGEQQKAIIRIHKLQDIIKGMYENIRRYNLRINQKNKELDDLINDSNDDYYERKNHVIIKKKIKKHEDTIIQLEKFIEEERTGIDKANVELDYLLDQVNKLRNSV
jgi:hypothetical protein